MHVYIHRIMLTHSATPCAKKGTEWGRVLKLLAKQINNKDGECERILAAGIEAKVLLILNQEAGRCRELHAKKARYVAGIKVLFGSIPSSPSPSLPIYPSLSA